MSVILLSGPKDDLLWEEEIEEIKGLERVEIEFQLDLRSRAFRFRDPVGFYSRSIAMTEFNERIASLYAPKISAVFLYKGGVDFRAAIEVDASLREDFLLWKGEYFKEETDQVYRVFSIGVLMEYLHRLGAQLREDLSLFVELDFRAVTRISHQAELLANFYFPYIKPKVRGLLLQEEESATLGVVLPELGRVPYDRLDAIFGELHEENIPYRSIPEASIVELWHGIDDLIVLPDTLSPEGIRRLKGFNAAGGRVLFVGERIGLSFEEDYNEVRKSFRSRGIRTPDPLVPNQMR